MMRTTCCRWSHYPPKPWGPSLRLGSHPSPWYLASFLQMACREAHTATLFPQMLFQPDKKKHTLIGQGCICKAWAGWASLKTASWRKDDHHKTSPQPPGTSGSHSSCTYHSCRALSSHLALWGPHLLNWGSHFMGSDKSGRPPDNTFLILLFSYWQLCQCFSHENKIPKAPTVQLH